MTTAHLSKRMMDYICYNCKLRTLGEKRVGNSVIRRQMYVSEVTNKVVAILTYVTRHSFINSSVYIRLLITEYDVEIPNNH